MRTLPLRFHALLQTDQYVSWRSVLEHARIAAALLAFVFAASAGPAAAQSPQVRRIAAAAPRIELLSAEERGALIAQELARRDSGWGDSTATVRMIVRSRQGEESVHELRSQRLELEDGSDRRLMVFQQPADLQETALLSVAWPRRSGEQWLYRAADGRAQRVSASRRFESFAGSEFAYEDLSPMAANEYVHTWLRSARSDGLELHVLERRPVRADSGYSRQVVWVDAQEYRVWKVDFYDRGDELLKTLRLLAYREYPDGHWRPHFMHMSNHRTGGSTTLEWSRYRFRTGLRAQDFDPTRLGRRR